MEEEDDDVIFDRAGLLSSNTIKPPPDVEGRKLRIYCTVCLCAAFFGLVSTLDYFFMKSNSDNI